MFATSRETPFPVRPPRVTGLDMRVWVPAACTLCANRAAVSSSHAVSMMALTCVLRMERCRYSVPTSVRLMPLALWLSTCMSPTHGVWWGALGPSGSGWGSGEAVGESFMIAGSAGSRRLRGPIVPAHSESRGAPSLTSDWRRCVNLLSLHVVHTYEYRHRAGSPEPRCPAVDVVCPNGHLGRRSGCVSIFFFLDGGPGCGSMPCSIRRSDRARKDMIFGGARGRGGW